MTAAARLDSDRALALGFAPPDARAGLAALWALDVTLGQSVATTTEPLIGQMRLTWWHECLTTLDSGGAVPAEPVLAGLADHALSGDVTGAAFASMIDGWEALLDPLPLTDAGLLAFAQARGGGLFALSARMLGGAVDPRLGAGWALADFARRCSDADTRARAWALAAEALHARDPIGVKPLRILIRLAREDLRLNNAGFARTRSRLGFLRAVLG